MSNGKASYNSNLIYKDEKIDSIFDPLNYFLTKSNFSSIQIYAWFKTYLLWSEANLPLNENQFYYSCNNCICYITKHQSFN